MIKSFSPAGDGFYRLVISTVVAQQIRLLQRQASRQNRGAEFLAAIRTAFGRMQKQPLEFGEPLYPLPALRVQVRCAVVPPLAVHFAVHNDLPIVFVNNVKLLSRRGS